MQKSKERVCILFVFWVVDFLLWAGCFNHHKWGFHFLESCWCIWKQRHVCRFLKGATDLVCFGSGRVNTLSSMDTCPEIEHCVSYQFQPSSTLPQGSSWSYLPLCRAGRSGSSSLSWKKGIKKILICSVSWLTSFINLLIGGGSRVWSFWRPSLKASLKFKGLTVLFVYLLLCRHMLKRIENP